MNVIILDYGLGNLGSLVNMCKKIGIKAKTSMDEIDIKSATHLVLPGVGAFDNGMKNLSERGLLKLLNKKVIDENTPILGICLGAQLMLQFSEEGNMQGLGWIKGKVIRFKKELNIKVPHMGWNYLTFKPGEKLFDNMPEIRPRFYFVHAYHFNIENDNEIIAECNYGYDFPAAFRKNNIVGVQFHPEKSHKFGMQLLLNFFELI